MDNIVTKNISDFKPKCGYNKSYELIRRFEYYPFCGNRFDGEVAK